MREKAEALIADIVKPLVEADGGSIELVSVVDQRVVVRLSGTCSGCPGRPYTLTRIVEPALRRFLGHDIVVEAESE